MREFFETVISQSFPNVFSTVIDTYASTNISILLIYSREIFRKSSLVDFDLFWINWWIRGGKVNCKDEFRMNFYLEDCRVVRFSGSKNKWWKLFFENIERKNVLKKCEKCVPCREEVCSGSDRCSVARQASPRIRFLSLPPRVPDPVGSLIKFPF